PSRACHWPTVFGKLSRLFRIGTASLDERRCSTSSAPIRSASDSPTRRGCFMGSASPGAPERGESYCVPQGGTETQRQRPANCRKCERNPVHIRPRTTGR